MRDFSKEAKQDALTQRFRKAWIAQRVEAIKEHVSAHDVLRRGGVNLGKGDNEEEQFSCPFHGQDRRPSARVYPADANNPSHAWCFVCQERWDAITLWRKFNGGEDRHFTQILSEIERAYGLETPELPLAWKLLERTKLWRSFVGFTRHARTAYEWLVLSTRLQTT